MKRLLMLCVLAGPASALAAGEVTEVLVATTATKVPSTALNDRSALEVQNLGPNPIYCAFSAADAVATKARRVDAGATWSVAARNLTIWCIATVAQVTGAATIATEVQTP